MVKHWYRLTRDVVKSQFLEIFKVWQGTALSGCCSWWWWSRGWIRQPPEVPVSFRYFCILWLCDFASLLYSCCVPPNSNASLVQNTLLWPENVLYCTVKQEPREHRSACYPEGHGKRRGILPLSCISVHSLLMSGAHKQGWEARLWKDVVPRPVHSCSPAALSSSHTHSAWAAHVAGDDRGKCGPNHRLPAIRNHSDWKIVAFWDQPLQRNSLETTQAFRAQDPNHSSFCSYSHLLWTWGLEFNWICKNT